MWLLYVKTHYKYNATLGFQDSKKYKISKFFLLFTYRNCVFLMLKLQKIIFCHFLNMAPKKLEIASVVGIWVGISPFHLHCCEQSMELRILASGLSKSYFSTFYVEKGKVFVL